MDREVVILKPAELILKSKGVRRQFENRLIFNIKDCLKKNEIEFDQVVRGQGRYFIYTPEPNEVTSQVKNIFGIANLCAAAQVGAEIGAINLAVLDLAKELKVTSKSTFGIRAITINTPMKSRDVENTIGAFIQKKTRAKVSLTKPKFWLRVEIVGKKAFVYSEIIEGLSGLPLGVSGKVLVLMSDKKRDVLACWLMMRRGCEIIPLHFRSDEKKLSQFQKNCKKLARFAWGSRIKPVSIKEKKDMKKEIREIVRKTGAKAYVFGNTKLHIRDSDLPIFEPLIGLDKRELKKLMDRL